MSPVFDAASIHAAVDQALLASAAPADKNAFVVIATTTGVKAVLATRLDDHWTVAGLFAVDHEQHIDGGIEVKATW